MMKKSKLQPSINGRVVLVTAIAVLATWLLHEFAHWITGEWLGNEMVMTLNTSYPVTDHYLHASHENMVSAAGPIITLIQAIIIYFLLKGEKNRILFPFLLTCLYMRTLAGLLNIINLNDEGRISKDLGLGVYTLPLLVIAVLFYLVYGAVKEKGFSTKFIVGSVLLIMLFSSIIVLADQAMELRIL
jgi:hypothetical protein